MKVSVIGTGYVGLVSGVCLAEIGHEIICVDIDQDKVDTINQGKPPIFEEGLERLLQTNLGNRFHATTNLNQAIQDSEITLVAVGTPFDGQKIELQYITQASKEIGKALKTKDQYHTVVIKSTVVPGTTDNTVLPLLEEYSEKTAGVDFGVGVNPEFLTEGVAVKDFMNPDRIVIGGMDDRTVSSINVLYEIFKDAPVVRTNNKTAEMTKYASNSILATCISFSNEIANLCSAISDIDAMEVMRGVHLSQYFTTKLNNGDKVTAPITSFLEPGCGFGGSCLPKDVKALCAEGTFYGQRMELLNQVIQINDRQPKKIVDILRKNFDTLKNLKVGILGLAFKPDTDDIRESPAIFIIDQLAQMGVKIRVYDPIAMTNAKQELEGLEIEYATSLEDCLRGLEAIIIVTKWKEFECVPNLLIELKENPVVIDGRRFIPVNSVENYHGIGI